MKASEQIRSRLEMAIAAGELQPGDPIDEAALARQYKVSRTPVREAMLALQAQGVLSNLPRNGMIVRKMDLQQLLSLWELLGELEGVAVRLACERMDSAELRTLKKRHTASKKAATKDDVAGWQEANLGFHEHLYQCARNPFLRQEVLRLRSRTGIYRRHAFGALGQIQASFDQHATIVAAIEARDANLATECMRAHMRPGRDAKSLNDFIISLPQTLMDTA
ncbi:MAG: GntR family transcriptional regulator [Betaproteobacteria bacterium]|nr:GntR family transcriptional regulator [Betaproteobacteria bacterium]NBY04570.1 GntR family transcriptional regulator [Betaproteobacteria bacterium]